MLSFLHDMLAGLPSMTNTFFVDKLVGLFGTVYILAIVKTREHEPGQRLTLLTLVLPLFLSLLLAPLLSEPLYKRHRAKLILIVRLGLLLLRAPNGAPIAHTQQRLNVAPSGLLQDLFEAAAGLRLLILLLIGCLEVRWSVWLVLQALLVARTANYQQDCSTQLLSSTVMASRIASFHEFMAGICEPFFPPALLLIPKSELGQCKAAVAFWSIVLGILAPAVLLVRPQLSNEEQSAAVGGALPPAQKLSWLDNKIASRLRVLRYDRDGCSVLEWMTLLALLWMCSTAGMPTWILHDAQAGLRAKMSTYFFIDQLVGMFGVLYTLSVVIIRENEPSAQLVLLTLGLPLFLSLLLAPQLSEPCYKRHRAKLIWIVKVGLMLLRTSDGTPMAHTQRRLDQGPRDLLPHDLFQAAAGLRLLIVLLLGCLELRWSVWLAQQVLLVARIANYQQDCSTQLLSSTVMASHIATFHEVMSLICEPFVPTALLFTPKSELGQCKAAVAFWSVVLGIVVPAVLLVRPQLSNDQQGGAAGGVLPSAQKMSWLDDKIASRLRVVRYDRDGCSVLEWLTLLALLWMCSTGLRMTGSDLSSSAPGASALHYT